MSRRSRPPVVPSSVVAVLIVALATTFPLAPAARAQSSGIAALAVTAKVVQPLVVAVTQPLDFGTVFVGGNKALVPSSPSAGVVDVQGQAGGNVSITLTMPQSLALGSTGTTLPLSTWRYTPSTTTSMSSFDNDNVTALALALPNVSGQGHLTIRIGAIATAAVNQAPGDYTGTGQVAVAYTDF